MVKTIIGGLLSGIILNVVGWIFDKTLLVDLYAHSPEVFLKPMDEIWLAKMIVFYFIVGMILAFTYHIFKHRVPGSGFIKGLTFGALLWLAAYLPAMTFMYLIVALRAKLIFMWALNWFFNFTLAGGILGFIDEEKK